MLRRLASFFTRWAPRLTRFLLAIILLLAASLKAYDLRLNPPVSAWRWLGDGALTAVESALAIWLLTGYRWQFARRVAILWMLLLAAISLHKALAGQTSCGCFGQLQVNPWITVTLDLACLAALLFSPAAASASPLPLSRHIALAAAHLFLLASLALVLASPLQQKVRPRASFTELHPQDWLHHPLPLTPYLQLDADLTRGPWAILFFNPDCHHCMPLIDEYEALARRWRQQASPAQVALIDVTADSDTPPGAGLPPATAPSLAYYGRLGGPADWFLATPTLVLLVDGRVVGIAEGEDDCAWNHRPFPP